MVEFVVEDAFAQTALRWPDAEHGPWQVVLSWRPTSDHVVQCCGIALEPMDQEECETITASLVRSLPVASLIAEGRRVKYRAAGGDLLDALDAGENVPVSRGFEDAARREASSWLPTPKRGRPPMLGAEHYREVARHYTAALTAGASPLKAVESRWTVSRPTASRWVARARESGLLPPTQRGRARGNARLLSNGE